MADIEITAFDFDRLCKRSVGWEPDLLGVRGWWENHHPDADIEDIPPMDHAHTWAHEVGPDWVAVILARSFLSAHGHVCVPMWDIEELTYWIVTGYRV